MPGGEDDEGVRMLVWGHPGPDPPCGDTPTPSAGWPLANRR